jgi:TetR/AcrR family transcriptional regulator, tetracycline repressor protein
VSAGSDRKSLTRDVIVDTALELMVQRGLNAVTLRRIATELNVSAPTLYWYISSKRELLDSLAEHLVRRGRTEIHDRPREGQPWWQWLEQRSRAMFQAMVAVRDAPQVVAGNRPTVDILPTIESALGELVAVGFDVAEAQEVFFVLGGYIGGMALEYQAEQGRVEEGVDDSVLAAAIGDSGRFPHLSAAVSHAHGHGFRSTFDYGLSLLIRGIRSRHAELTGAAPVPMGDLGRVDG